MKLQRGGESEGTFASSVEELACLVARLEPGDTRLLDELREKAFRLRSGDPDRYQGQRLFNLVKTLTQILEGDLPFEDGYRRLVQHIESLQEGCERAADAASEPPRLSTEEAEYQEMLIGVFCELIRDMEGKDPHLIAYCKRSAKKIEGRGGLSPEIQEHLKGIALLLDYLDKDKIEFDEAHRLMMNVIIQLERVTREARVSVDAGGQHAEGDSAEQATAETLPAEDGCGTARAGSGVPEQAEGRTGRIPEDLDLDELKDFLEEAPEFIQASEASLLELENDPGDLGLLYEAFRGFHNIKGSASFLGLEEVVELTHACENILAGARDGKTSLSRREAARLLEAVDALREMVGSIGKAGAGAPYPLPRRLDEIIAGLAGSSKVRSDTVGSAVGGGESPHERSAPAGEEAAAEAGAAATGETALPGEGPPEGEKATDTAPESGGRDVDAAGGRKSSDTFIRVGTERLDNLIDAVGELVIAQAMLVQETENGGNGHGHLSSTVSQLSKITREVQELAMSMRMVSLKSTFHKMRRLVRDLSSRSGVPVVFTFSGEETEIDRNMVEELHLPLVHMIRNAVDHGIEEPEVRRSLGKPDAGRIHLSGYHEGGAVVISLEDDGRGFDRGAILARAVSEGLVKGEAHLDEGEIDRLAFSKGLSTAREVTDVSGRGMGLDIVRHTVEKLHGRVETESRPGRGTRFTIRLPLTLAIIEGMVVRVAGEHYVIPSNSILESIQVRREELTSVLGQGEAIDIRGEVVPLYRFHRLFEIDGAIEDPSDAIAIVLEEGRDKFALMVDDIIGQQQVVIKSLGDCFSRVGEFSGGAILGSGRVALIVNPQGMLQTAHAV